MLTTKQLKSSEDELIKYLSKYGASSGESVSVMCLDFFGLESFSEMDQCFDKNKQWIKNHILKALKGRLYTDGYDPTIKYPSLVDALCFFFVK